QQATHNDLLGFQAAMIAEDHASTPEVRAFAAQSAAADVQLFGQLVPFVGRAGVPLPTLTAQDQAMLRDLADEPVLSLDARFLQMNVVFDFQNMGLLAAASQRGGLGLSGLRPVIAATIPQIAQNLSVTATLLNGIGGDAQ